MCMHNNIEHVIASIERMNVNELDRIQKAIVRRRQQVSDKPQSIVETRKPYLNGVLQKERRVYKETGKEHGPYWYFHYREGGKQHTKYIGKTDDPESKVDELIGGE